MVIGILFLDIWPLIYNINLSFRDMYLLRPQDEKFIGLSNYWSILHDPDFWYSLSRTAIYTGGSVVLQIFGGLVLALCLNQKFLGRNIARSMILFPWMIPGAIAGLVWLWMANASVGLLNDLLFKLRLIKNYVPFLGNPTWAIITVTIANGWKGFPFFTVAILASLQSIPIELYDAAQVDGAGLWSRFKYITLPHIRGVILILIILGIIWTFNYVDIILVATRGGPAGATTTTPLYAYFSIFRRFRAGYGTAVSTIALFLTMVIGWIYIKTLGIQKT